MTDTFDALAVKDQLGIPDATGLSFAITTETVSLGLGPFVFQKSPNPSPNGFILGSGGRGVLGASGNPLGIADGTVTSHYIVQNDNNTFQWWFRHSMGTRQSDGCYDTIGFTDTVNSTATENTTSTFCVTATYGQIWQSYSLYKDPTSTSKVVSAMINITAGDSRVFTVVLSADGGSHWESATLGTSHTFTNQGYDLRVKLTNNIGSGWPTLWGTWGWGGTTTISYINVQYTLSA